MRNRRAKYNIDNDSEADRDNVSAILQVVKEEIELAERLLEDIQEEYAKLTNRNEKDLFSVNIIKNSYVEKVIKSFCSSKAKSVLENFSDNHNYSIPAEVNEFTKVYISRMRNISDKFARLQKKAAQADVDVFISQIKNKITQPIAGVENENNIHRMFTHSTHEKTNFQTPDEQIQNKNLTAQVQNLGRKI